MQSVISSSTEGVKETAPIKILVLGGGAAGWLTASILAAEHSLKCGGDCDVVLVESPTIPTIGVGEGTWPSMRETLRRIGFSEAKLFFECDASFKQGSLFSGWVNGGENDQYYHPFSMPHGYFERDISRAAIDTAYAYAVTAQAAICDAGKAPKQPSTPEYAGVLNYGYHFDAGKFGRCLREHGSLNLGVKHVYADIDRVELSDDGNIMALYSVAGECMEADIFIDCTGSAALLIGEACKVPWVSQAPVLFNDRALAVQIPYAEDFSPVASVTRATARQNGWIWDIGLTSRRGLGYVYSSQYISDSAAELDFRSVLKAELPVPDVEALKVRQLSFSPGYREVFWTQNCIAIGMSAGFIEPLEASALALVEHAAALVRDLLPGDIASMPIARKRFNSQMQSHWNNIIDFIKLHYALSKRSDSDYWLAHQRSETWPDSLAENLHYWRRRAPARQDFPEATMLFPAASYRFVLNGMGYPCTHQRSPKGDFNPQRSNQLLSEVKAQEQKFLQGLLSNRDCIAQWKKDFFSAENASSTFL